MGGHTLRPFREEDADIVRALIVELQDSLRFVDPRLPAGDSIADAYVRHTLDRCRECDGRIILAEVDGEVVGLATVLTRVAFKGLDERQGHFAYLMDLVVRSAHRGAGVGRALLNAAESAAREAGAREFRTLVLSDNRAANLYRRAGMKDYSITLTKDLTEHG